MTKRYLLFVLIIFSVFFMEIYKNRLLAAGEFDDIELGSESQSLLSPIVSQSLEREKEAKTRRESADKAETKKHWNMTEFEHLSLDCSTMTLRKIVRLSTLMTPTLQ